MAQDEVLEALGLVLDDLRIDVCRDETTVSVRLTHLPTGCKAIGTDSGLGGTTMHPSSIRATRLAGRWLLDMLEQHGDR